MTKLHTAYLTDYANVGCGKHIAWVADAEGAIHRVAILCGDNITIQKGIISNGDQVFYRCSGPHKTLVLPEIQDENWTSADSAPTKPRRSCACRAAISGC